MTSAWKRAGAWGATLAAFLIAASNASAQTPAEDGDFDEPPRLMKQTRPKYPAEPFSNRVEGTVEIQFVIDETGRVTEPRVVKSIPGLEKAALDCVKKWKFRPARKQGRAVKASALAPVTFRIGDKKD